MNIETIELKTSKSCLIIFHYRKNKKMFAKKNKLCLKKRKMLAKYRH